jgi:adenosyl cobinamide kinase/adenosyl cobinamide phosphate guanylyltransferase
MGLRRAVPAEVDALARAIEAGLAHQRLAAVCEEVVLMVAGLPVFLKRP